MTAVPEKKKLTPEEYLAIENAAEFKSEFFDGVMYPLHQSDDGLVAMAGATPEHNRVKGNLVGELFIRFKSGPCQTFSSDQRVRLTDTGKYAYPDVVTVCEPPAFAPDDRNTLINPQVVIEVLSPATERYDRGL
jgi:Uma2 family endonuclease